MSQEYLPLIVIRASPTSSPCVLGSTGIPDPVDCYPLIAALLDQRWKMPIGPCRATKVLKNAAEMEEEGGKGASAPKLTVPERGKC